MNAKLTLYSILRALSTNTHARWHAHSHKSHCMENTFRKVWDARVYVCVSQCNNDIQLANVRRMRAAFAMYRCVLVVVMMVLIVLESLQMHTQCLAKWGDNGIFHVERIERSKRIHWYGRMDGVDRNGKIVAGKFLPILVWVEASITSQWCIHTRTCACFGASVSRV